VAGVTRGALLSLLSHALPATLNGKTGISTLTWERIG
jgi:hypothetical protein